MWDRVFRACGRLPKVRSSQFVSTRSVSSSTFLNRTTNADCQRHGRRRRYSSKKVEPRPCCDSKSPDSWLRPSLQRASGQRIGLVPYRHRWIFRNGATGCHPARLLCHRRNDGRSLQEVDVLNHLASNCARMLQQTRATPESEPVRCANGSTPYPTTPCFLPTATKASTACCRCSVSCAALIWTRMRAAPLGTTGYEKPMT